MAKTGHSMWSGTLGFGMVAIPVKVHKATEAGGGGSLFNSIHADCDSRIRQPSICPTCREEAVEQLRKRIVHYEVNGNVTECLSLLDRIVTPVHKDDVWKGFPNGKDEDGKEQFIPVSPAELNALKLESIKAIQIQAFVSPETFSDIRWGNSTYWLAPDGDGALRAFALLSESMNAEGVLGFAKVTFREREQLCVLHPRDGGILLQTVHWPSEIRDHSSLLTHQSLSEPEVALGRKLVGSMTKPIKIEEYTDEYRTAVLDMVGRKALGQEPILAPETKKPTADLTAALEASLAAMT